MDRKKRRTCPHGLYLFLQSTRGLLFLRGKNVNIDLIVSNNGRENEDIDLTVTLIPQRLEGLAKDV